MAHLAISVPARHKTQIAPLLWHWSMALLAVALLCFITVPSQADPDLWGHLRFGLDILNSHAIPSTDPYSFTAAGAPWIDHEWLAELLFALAWTGAGPSGLVALKIGLALLTGGLCFGHLLRAGVSSDRAAAILLMFVALIPAFMTIRPLLFTIPCFAVTLIVLYQAEQGRLRALWILPPLYALWANLHGGFLAGFGLLGIWAVVRSLSGWRRAFPAVLALAGAGTAACLNPYGWTLLAFLIRTASVPRPEIIEWVPLRASSEYGIMYLVVLGLSLAGLVRSRLEKPLPLTVLFGATSILPFLATRHTPLAVVAAVVLAGPHLGDALEQMSSRRTRSTLIPGWAPVLSSACVVVVAFATFSHPPAISLPPDLYPARAVQVLSDSGVEGNLIHRFNWGEYLIWHLGPKVKVMMDGRRETVYADTVYRQYLDFQDGTGDWDKLIRDYPADVALLEKASVSANLFRLKTEWTEVYEDKVAVIFARRKTPVAGRLISVARAGTPRAGVSDFP
jgi:hypothetical protein